MEVKNLQLLKDVPFEDYLAMPGWSYSNIRNEGVVFDAPTKKMQLGTHVHNYLLTPEEYKYDDIEIVKPLATAVKHRLGALMAHLTPELAVICDFVCNGFNMRYKGRLDLSVPNLIVVDLKVSEQPLPVGIKYFGYDKQLSGYALAIGAKVAIIISIHPKKKTISVYNIPINVGWWENQVLQKGEPQL